MAVGSKNIVELAPAGARGDDIEDNKDWQVRYEIDNAKVSAVTEQAGFSVMENRCDSRCIW